MFRCSEIFCKKEIKAASLAAAMDLSWTRVSCSLFNLASSCIFQASSLAMRSCSRFSIASMNCLWSSSCLLITSLAILSKKSFHFRFLFLLPATSSSDDTDKEDDDGVADADLDEDGIGCCSTRIAGTCAGTCGWGMGLLMGLLFICWWIMFIWWGLVPLDVTVT